MVTPNSLAELLRHIRLAQRWTEWEVARKVNIAEHTLRLWEGGEQTPSELELWRLASLYMTPYTDLLRRANREDHFLFALSASCRQQYYAFLGLLPTGVLCWANVEGEPTSDGGLNLALNYVGKHLRVHLPAKAAGMSYVAFQESPYRIRLQDHVNIETLRRAIAWLCEK
jgi:transcriptional regulator with XRE-family HTH domain